MSPSILRIRCPTEYFYLTPPQGFEQWAGVLTEIRHENNHVRPHEALQM